MDWEPLMRKAKVYKVELMVIDFEGFSEEQISTSLDYALRDMVAGVIGIKGREVDWDDSHPLNRWDTQKAAFKELFGGES